MDGDERTHCEYKTAQAKCREIKKIQVDGFFHSTYVSKSTMVTPEGLNPTCRSLTLYCRAGRLSEKVRLTVFC